MPDLNQGLPDAPNAGATLPFPADDGYYIDPATYREERGSGKFLKADFPEMTEPRVFVSINEEIFIISDLHIATGRNSLGVYSGSENFFADEAFARFLQHAAGAARNAARRGLLVINGDSFDFLRVSETPAMGEFANWRRVLRKLGIEKSEEELKGSISCRERRYGLETDDYKTIYKLIRIREGHPGFFAALGNWLASGHRLLMTKGNHDLELVWPAVRNYIRLILAEEMAMLDGSRSLQDILTTSVIPNVHFYDDAVLVGKDLYIEHGHRYDKFTMVLDDPFIKLKKGTQINIPFGSFFNRYLINRLELAYPFLDKVRPAGNLLPILVRENLRLAIEVFFKQIPLLLRILRTNRRYLGFMLRRATPLLFALVPILAYLLWAFWPYLTKTSPTQTSILKTWENTMLRAVGSIGSLVLSYFVARLVAFLQLVEPSSLNAYARHVINRSGRGYRVMTMGHTHNPDACDAKANKAIFYNSGTWIPVIEIATAAVREDKIYTFLHLATDTAGALLPHDNLQRWNDDAEREDPQLIIDPK